MKLNYTLTMLCCLAISTILTAQDRYLAPVFDDVEITSNVIYGSNYTVLVSQLTGTTLLQPLAMDVYQPSGDTISERPLVLVLHTGNFLPIQTNGGVTGEKTDFAVVEVCNRLAKMGYVAVSVDYRLGWNPLAESQPERALGLINAAYRGVQDTRTAIRYFKRDVAEGGNSYGIDTSKITVWGQGTGGYIALATATLDDYNKIITTTNPVGKFITDLNGDGVPDAMINEPINGDINGATIVGQSPGGAIPAGDTLALPNHTGYSSDYQLTVNMGGALGDISWLDENSTPVISFHVVNDQFAPYKDDILVVPTTGDPIVQVQGSYAVDSVANDVGINDVLTPEGDDDEFTLAAKAAAAKSGDPYQEGLYPFNIPLNILGQADGSPWNWWDPARWDSIPHPSSGTGNIPAGLSFHEISLLSNMDMSPEKGKTYIDTIMGYFAPRAYQALGLSPDSTTAVAQLDKSQVSLIASPNPSNGLLTIESAVDYEIRSVQIYDVAGKLVLRKPNVNANQIRINHTALNAGTYFVEIRFDKGVITEKVLFNN